ncbi:MAG: flagellar biosynthesis anti-sigma factor FlgM [Deltaproteobacteria bacterium]|nr:flagellar biosynthesis anti-sigma factor FlgM [Deltaproteobacteria bacterium]
MKIGDSNKIVTLDPRNNGSNGKVNGHGEKSNGLSSPSKTTISEMGGTLSEIRAELEKVPDVRMDKVEAIRAEIEAGRYERPADEVAEKLLTSSLFDSLFIGA